MYDRRMECGEAGSGYHKTQGRKTRQHAEPKAHRRLETGSLNFIIRILQKNKKSVIGLNENMMKATGVKSSEDERLAKQNVITKSLRERTRNTEDTKG